MPLVIVQALGPPATSPVFSEARGQPKCHRSCCQGASTGVTLFFATATTWTRSCGWLMVFPDFTGMGHGKIPQSPGRISGKCRLETATPISASSAARSRKNISQSSRTCNILNFDGVAGAVGESRSKPKQDPVRFFHSGKEALSDITSASLGVSLLPLFQARRPDHLLAYERKPIIVRCRLLRAARLASSSARSLPDSGMRSNRIGARPCPPQRSRRCRA
ncbi:hypothetical protein EVAR_102466_1 [Eumeta japonica]|uniref:Uncharacterized protein n=1 Tax=Eumeta variegata TaxID=151549 RepID=A0A4C1ZUK7_EUMVA|nr:hypothetical protein EVAR_102466_1 [Eumeta japonica]